MKLTKEECLEALDNLKVPTDNWDSNDLQLAENNEEPIEYYEQESIDLLEQLINKHFDNPPLKFEELEVGKWYWDNFQKEWFKLYELRRNCFLKTYWSIPTEFEENRFYRKQVEE